MTIINRLGSRIEVAVKVNPPIRSIRDHRIRSSYR
jgi:hypothetical protein